MEELGQKTEYLKILKAFLLEEEDYKRKVQILISIIRDFRII